MFVDRVKLRIKAGNGGNGMIAFRREKYVDKGGPSGGDGGRGASIYFIADSGLNTLLDFKYTKKIVGGNGENGGGKNAYGRGAEDIELKVPVGTVVFNEDTGLIIANFKKPGQRELIAKGGRGGRGNSKFATSVNQVPRVAENGAPGEEFNARIELRVLADVGLVGFPSVGKSTLLSSVSAARPEIASYHFTTLNPHLGMVQVEEGNSFVMADLPGLIEGAHEGKGLGLNFLRHIERCRVLVHVIDMASTEGRDPVEDFHIINKELESYNLKLLERPMVVVANKMDDEGAILLLEDFKERVGDKYKVFPISALTREGLQPLLYYLADLLKVTPEFPLFGDDEKVKVYKYISSVDDEKGYKITRPSEHVFVISGARIEKIYKMTNISTDEGLMYLTSIIRKMGIEDELRQMGVVEGDTVRLCNFEFTYYD